MATGSFNQIINNGVNLYVDWSGDVLALLPANIKPASVAGVERYSNLMRRAMVIHVQFKNGLSADLELPYDGVDHEKLKEFQAACIMVHDI